MPSLGNPLVYDLLDLADTLAGQGGRINLRKASMRQAVSSAYYAVFHALCFVCAIEFRVCASPGDALEPVYRLIDHGAAKRRLTGREVEPPLLAIGTNIADLQEARHRADYSPPGLEVRLDETRSRIAVARQTVSLIEALAPSDRKLLAVLLITKPR